METKKDNLKKVKDNQADEPPLSETESKNASDDALPCLKGNCFFGDEEYATGKPY